MIKVQIVDQFCLPGRYGILSMLHPYLIFIHLSSLYPKTFHLIIPLPAFHHDTRIGSGQLLFPPSLSCLDTS